MKNLTSGKRACMIGVAVLVSLLAYTVVPPQSAKAACAAPSTNYGTATQTVSVATTATYKVWSRIMAPDATNNSYLLEIDGTCYTVGDGGITANTWTWVDYSDGKAGNKITRNLTAGTHTINVIGREPGVLLDRVLFVADQACVPSDKGDNCATAVDATPPTVGVTAPAAGSNLSGTVSVTANASDDSNVSKVEFYINDVLKSTDTSAPYNYGWDTKTGADGMYTLLVKAYDTANNTATDTVQVAVKNTDSQAPSAPSSLKASASAYNKVNLSWKASTDSVGVAKYRIWRGGTAIADIGPATSYTDTTTLPATTYAYQVTALDAAGNESAPSNQASITTPSQPDTQAPTTPDGVVATAVSSSQINLTWKASTDNIGVAAYDVYRAVTGGSASKVASVTTTSYGDTGLTSSTTYTYYVVARDAVGNLSGHSSSVSAKTQDTPTKPKGKGGLHGNVTDTRRKALAGVRIAVRLNGQKQIYSTNSSGNYNITDLPVDTYSLKYSRRGYSSQIDSVRIQDDKNIAHNIRLQSR